MILYILQCVVSALLVLVLLVIMFGAIINRPKINKVTVIDDISDTALSSMAKQLVENRKAYQVLDKKYDDKQIEVAVLTCEINDMVAQGGKTTLTKNTKTGGYNCLSED